MQPEQPEYPSFFQLYHNLGVLWGKLDTDPWDVVTAFATSRLEWWALAFTLASVILAWRQSVLTWPLGLVGVVLYGKLFYEGWLYSEVALQIFFFVTQFVGWWSWIRLVQDKTGESFRPVWWRTLTQGFLFWKPFPVQEPDFKVQSLDYRLFALCIAFIIGMAFAMEPRMASIGAKLPFWDGLVAWSSAVAQVLLIRKYWQNWIIWVAVDILYLGVFSYKGWYPSAALYVVFGLIAAYSLVSWLRLYARQQTHPSVWKVA